MEALPRWRIVSDREVREVTAKMATGQLKKQAGKVGSEVHADAVLFGRVIRFNERVGAAGGVKSPASVAFDLFLLDVKMGDIIWSARFRETQEPLSENILALGKFAQRRARWLTAEELAREGIKKVILKLHRTLYPNPT
jgi:hypothetical protein